MQNTVLTVSNKSSIDPNYWIADGRELAKKEGVGVFETIERLFDAETTTAGAAIAAMNAHGANLLKQYRVLQDRLVALGFDVARHLRAIARGKLDLGWLIALTILNLVLAILVLTLADGPLWMTLLLGLLVTTTAVPVEEFFMAHHEKKSLREGLFLALSLLALAATFWIGTLRGTFMLGVDTEAIGPATDTLRYAAKILGFGLGILALVSELLAGYKAFLVRHRLYSTMARTAKKRDEIAEEMVGLQSGIKATDAEPQIRRDYRVVGARQFLAEAERSEPTAHLRRAVVGAAITLLVVIALFFIASIASAEPSGPPARTLKVVMVDLTQSSKPEDFENNKKAVEMAINMVPSKGRIVVTGISDGFGSPRLLLDQVVEGEGSFGLKLQSSREVARARWRKAASAVTLSYDKTSVVGSIALLQYLTNEPFDLIILSDGRENVLVNIANVAAIDVPGAIKRLKKKDAIPPLHNVRVHMLGVSSEGTTPTYFLSLRNFWQAYFKEAGAELVTFRVDRTLPF